MMIAEGKHRAKGVTYAMGKTNKGDPQVAVEFELLDVPGARLTWYGNFSETTVGEDQKPVYQITLESLYHCGWISGDLQDLTGVDQNEVTVIVKHEEYQGKTRPKIAWVNKLSSGVAMKNPMAPNELSVFAARMKGASMSTRKALNIPPADSLRQKLKPATPKTPPPGAGDAWEPPSDSPPEWMND